MIGDDTGALYAKGYGHVFYESNSYTVETNTKVEPHLIVLVRSGFID